MQGLEPGERAILDLWAHRRLDDNELAAMLGVDTDAIATRREDALTRLAASEGLAGVDRAELLGSLRALAPSEWERAVRGPPLEEDEPAPDAEQAQSGGAAAPAEGANGAREGEPGSAAKGESATAGVGAGVGAAPAPRRGGERSNGSGPKRRRSSSPAARAPSQRVPRQGRGAVIVALVGLAAALLVAIVALAGNAGGDGSPAPRTGPPISDAPGPDPAPRPEPAPPPGPASPPVALRAVTPSVEASGRVRLAGDGATQRLTIELADLPGGGAEFQVWLYNSLDDAVPVARTKGPAARFSAPVPANSNRYRFLDVSRAGPGRVHSGESLLRVPLAELAPGAPGGGGKR